MSGRVEEKRRVPKKYVSDERRRRKKAELLGSGKCWIEIGINFNTRIVDEEKEEEIKKRG